MSTLGEEARSFRSAFNQEIIESLSIHGYIKKALWDMQLKLIDEEHKELVEAAGDVFADPENSELRENLIKEISDLVFVSYQFAVAFGFDLDTAMARVYESNMSKLDKHGKPIYRVDGKVLKGPNYKKPDLSDCYPQPKLNSK